MVQIGFGIDGEEKGRGGGETTKARAEIARPRVSGEAVFRLGSGLRPSSWRFLRKDAVTLSWVEETCQSARSIPERFDFLTVVASDGPRLPKNADLFRSKGRLDRL